MTAPVRLKAVRSFDVLSEHWHRAVPIRQEWQAWGLATAPADRAVAEQSLTRIYARIGRNRPRFEWVDSPRQALDRLDGLPTHEDLRRWVVGRPPPGRPPLASDLAAGLSRLRSALDDGLTSDDLGSAAPLTKDKKPWPVRPPVEALQLSVPLREVLRQGVRLALETSFGPGFYLPVRAVLGLPVLGLPVLGLPVLGLPVLGLPGRLPVGWYGQQDSGWIAYYDMMRRLGLGRYASADDAGLDDWAALARSCGWWWPDENRIVAVERPAVIRVLPVPGTWHHQSRLDPTHPAPVEYRDGWQPFPGPASEVRGDAAGRLGQAGSGQAGQ
jgi:hypothetical protein